MCVTRVTWLRAEIRRQPLRFCHLVTQLIALIPHGKIPRLDSGLRVDQKTIAVSPEVLYVVIRRAIHASDFCGRQLSDHSSGRSEDERTVWNDLSFGDKRVGAYQTV